MELFTIAIVLFIVALLGQGFFIIWFRLQNWKKKPTTPQERVVLLYILRNLPDLEGVLLLFSIVMLIIGFISMGREELMWDLFVIVFIVLILAVLSQRELQKTIKSRLHLDDSDCEEKCELKNHVSYRSRKILWLRVGLVILLVSLSLNTLYHFNILFSPDCDFEKEFTAVIIRLLGFVFISSLLINLSALEKIVNEKKQTNSNRKTLSEKELD